jgi:polyisoprenoid-binding protein YceI
MKTISICLVSCVFFLSTAFKVDPIKSVRFDKANTSLTYHMSHPMHEWDGISKDVDGVVQFDAQNGLVQKVALVAKVSSFDSKNSNRDSHLLEITEAIKYPSVSFVSTQVKDNGGELEVQGKISFHNVTKEISFKAQSKTVSKNRVVTGSFILLIEDFNLERPSLMMVKTSNEMKMSFSVAFPVN